MHNFLTLDCSANESAQLLVALLDVRRLNILRARECKCKYSGVSRDLGLFLGRGETIVEVGSEPTTDVAFCYFLPFFFPRQSTIGHGVF